MFIMVTNILHWFLPSFVLFICENTSHVTMTTYTGIHMTCNYEKTRARARAFTKASAQTRPRKILLNHRNLYTPTLHPSLPPWFSIWVLLFTFFPKNVFCCFGNYLWMDSHAKYFQRHSFFSHWSYTYSKISKYLVGEVCTPATLFKEPLSLNFSQFTKCIYWGFVFKLHWIYIWILRILALCYHSRIISVHSLFQ